MSWCSGKANEWQVTSNGKYPPIYGVIDKMLTLKTTLFYLRHIFEVVVTPHGKLVSFGNVGTICTI